MSELQDQAQIIELTNLLHKEVEKYSTKSEKGLSMYQLEMVAMNFVVRLNIGLCRDFKTDPYKNILNLIGYIISGTESTLEAIEKEKLAKATKPIH